MSKHTKAEMKQHIMAEIKAQTALRAKADKEMKLIIRGKLSVYREILEML